MVVVDDITKNDPKSKVDVAWDGDEVLEMTLELTLEMVVELEMKMKSWCLRLRWRRELLKAISFGEVKKKEMEM